MQKLILHYLECVLHFIIPRAKTFKNMNQFSFRSCFNVINISNILSTSVLIPYLQIGYKIEFWA